MENRYIWNIKERQADGSTKNSVIFSKNTASSYVRLTLMNHGRTVVQRGYDIDEILEKNSPRVNVAVAVITAETVHNMLP